MYVVTVATRYSTRSLYHQHPLLPTSSHLTARVLNFHPRLTTMMRTLTLFTHVHVFKTILSDVVVLPPNNTTTFTRVVQPRR